MTAWKRKSKLQRKPLAEVTMDIKVVSVRMKEEMIELLDDLSAKTNRSRNELINLLLDAAMKIVKVEE